MMKFTQAINVAVASVLVVPAVTLQSGGAESLRASLDSTLLALETLAGIDTRLQEHAPEAVSEVLEHTEAAIELDPADPSVRDRLLDSLRTDVGLLQAKLDRAQGSSDGAVHGGLRTSPTVTTGLDDAMRALLAAKPVEPLTQVSPAADLESAAAPATDRVVFEEDGFTADPLRLGQAYYRKGRFAEAIAVLERERGAEAVYWKARSLEKIGDHESAIEAYTAVSEMEDAGPLASRALEDIEFLDWRLEFEQQTQDKQPR